MYDVFPSLHTAVTLVLLGHDRIHAPRRFLVMTPIGVLLIASTTALGLHYAVDVVAGIVLAMFVLTVFRHELSPAQPPAGG